MYPARPPEAPENHSPPDTAPRSFAVSAHRCRAPLAQVSSTPPAASGQEPRRFARRIAAAQEQLGRYVPIGL